ncbi:MAG: hypothetical protein AB7V32_04550, partial [Candidatus Berkiella sp.]
IESKESVIKLGTEIKKAKENQILAYIAQSAFDEKALVQLLEINIPNDVPAQTISGVLQKLQKFILENPTAARNHKDLIISFIEKSQISKNQKEAFDVRPLYYDLNPSEATENALKDVTRLRGIMRNKDKARDNALTDHPVFNIPDTALALTQGSRLGEEQLFNAALSNNFKPIKEIIAIGRNDFHYAIRSQETGGGPEEAFQEPDFTPYFEQGEIINKVGRIITYKVKVQGEERLVHHFPLKNKGVADLTPQETEYLRLASQRCQAADSKLLVHCKGGTGRTGALIGALLALEPAYAGLNFEEAFKLYGAIRSQASFGAAGEQKSQLASAKATFEALRAPTAAMAQDLKAEPEFLDSFKAMEKVLNQKYNELMLKNPDFNKFDRPDLSYKFLTLFNAGKFDELEKLIKGFDQSFKLDSDKAKLVFELSGNKYEINMKDYAQLAELSVIRDQLYQCQNKADVENVAQAVKSFEDKTKAVVPEPITAAVAVPPAGVVSPAVAVLPTETRSRRANATLETAPPVLQAAAAAAANTNTQVDTANTQTTDRAGVDEANAAGVAVSSDENAAPPPAASSPAAGQPNQWKRGVISAEQKAARAEKVKAKADAEAESLVSVSGPAQAAPASSPVKTTSRVKPLTHAGPMSGTVEELLTQDISTLQNVLDFFKKPPSASAEQTEAQAGAKIELNKEKMEQYGVLNITPRTLLGNEEHLTIQMKDEQNQNKKVDLNVGPTKQGGLVYTAKEPLHDDVIKNICKMAVDSAEPGDTFKLPAAETPQNQKMREGLLEAIKARCEREGINSPNEGVLAIPANAKSPTLKAQRSQPNFPGGG